MYPPAGLKSSSSHPVWNPIGTGLNHGGHIGVGTLLRVTEGPYVQRHSAGAAGGILRGGSGLPLENKNQHGSLW